MINTCEIGVASEIVVSGNLSAKVDERTRAGFSGSNACFPKTCDFRLFLSVAAVFAVIILTPIADASAQDLPKIRVATVNPNLVFSPVLVAISNGYFKKQGIEVETTVAWGVSSTISALTSATADIIGVGAGSVISMASSPDLPKSKIIAAADYDASLLVSRKKISLTDFKWQMLKGKSVMGWPHGSDPGLTFEKALRGSGLRPGRGFNHVTDVPFPARASSWMSGRADYGVFFEPFVTRFENQAAGFAVASVGQATGKLNMGVFATTDRYIAKHPKRVQAWITALHKAMSWIRANDSETMAKTIAAAYGRWKQAELAGGLKRLRDIGAWNWDLSIGQQTISDWQSAMIESGVMRPKARLPYERLVDPRFFQAAAKVNRK